MFNVWALSAHVHVYMHFFVMCFRRALIIVPHNTGGNHYGLFWGFFIFLCNDFVFSSIIVGPLDIEMTIFVTLLESWFDSHYENIEIRFDKMLNVQGH